MTQTPDTAGIADQIGACLPYLRRYARALTGSQAAGDAHAAAAIEAIMARPEGFDPDLPPKVALFRIFHRIWHAGGTPVQNEEDGLRARAQQQLGKLTPKSREALLLATIEEFATDDLARILDIRPDEATELLDAAFREMEVATRGKVLIIEDEAIIAMDLGGLVEEIGHTVTNVARTRDGAVRLGKADPPDLILADIQLADNSSGIDAVHDLLEGLGELPVIFITAFPERLLTGARPEPAFLISKPYTEAQVRTAISQAMFFASTETLKAAG